MQTFKGDIYNLFSLDKGVTKYGKHKLQLPEVHVYLSTDICTSRRRGTLLQKALWLGSCEESVVLDVQWLHPAYAVERCGWDG